MPSLSGGRWKGTRLTKGKDGAGKGSTKLGAEQRRTRSGIPLGREGEDGVMAIGWRGQQRRETNQEQVLSSSERGRGGRQRTLSLVGEKDSGEDNRSGWTAMGAENAGRGGWAATRRERCLCVWLVGLGSSLISQVVRLCL